MMHRKIPVLLVPLVLLCPGLGHAGLFGPSNYDECITDSMRGVSSDVAARAIIASCRNLFPGDPAEATQPAMPATAPTAPAAPAAKTPPPPASPADPPVEPPLDTSAARVLGADELARVSATAKVFGSSYRVKVSNNNPALTLTEVTIAVWDDNNAAASREEYTASARIAPGDSAEVRYTVQYRGDETGWNWGVVAARGMQQLTE